MDARTLRAWWSQRQGLDGSMAGQAPEQILETSGWARSVGGVNPYLTFHSRAGTARAEADQSVAEVRIHELPSARGCTYVIPQRDFALALKVGQPFSEPPINQAKKYLGVTEEELDRLAQRVLDALNDEPQDPAALKPALGDAVRSLGEEGKKRGVTTTLPMVLGRLQSTGEIRRAPVNGRLDQQRYGYVRWKGNPLKSFGLSQEEASTELARLYFRWIGPASQAHFQWFSGLGVKASADAIAPLRLVPLEPGGNLLLFEDDRDSLLSFSPPREPLYSLVASIDAILLHRREVLALLDEPDTQREMYGEKGRVFLRTTQDLSNHAILDRGRVIGLWEFDPEREEIVHDLWVPMDSALRAEIDRTEAYVRDQLGDARSFSLDSPESRKPKLEALRGSTVPA